MKFADKLYQQLKENEDQVFVLKALLMIILISIFGSLLKFFLFYIVPLLVLSFLFASSILEEKSLLTTVRQKLTLLPGIYSDNEKTKGPTPTVTYGLVIVNVFIFFVVQTLVGPEAIKNNFMCPPSEPSFWNVPLSFLTAVFLHGNVQHLAGNMFFLWGVGTLVERRVGSKNFFFIYLASGLFGAVFYVASQYIFLDKVTPGLGASGAISGIMGVYAVRCYFKTIILPLPLGPLPIYLKLRVNALVLMGLFFLMDLNASVDKWTGVATSSTGHSCHLGAMCFGLFLAYKLKLNKPAVEERHTEIGRDAVNEANGFGAGKASLRKVLELNPDNTDARLALARIKSKRDGISYQLTKEGADLYHGVIERLVSTAPQEAADIYVEYFQKFRKGLEPALLFKMANILYRRGQLDHAASALEMTVADDKTPEELKAKALFQAAKIMEEMNLSEAAERYYEQFLEQFPRSALAPKARRKLGFGFTAA